MNDIASYGWFVYNHFERLPHWPYMQKKEVLFGLLKIIVSVGNQTYFRMRLKL